MNDKRFMAQRNIDMSHQPNFGHSPHNEQNQTLALLADRQRRMNQYPNQRNQQQYNSFDIPKLTGMQFHEKEDAESSAIEQSDDQEKASLKKKKKKK